MRAEPILVTATGADQRSRGVLRGSGFTLTSRGVRLAAHVDDPVAHVRAAVAPLSRQATVFGPSAALVLGHPLPRHIANGARTHVLIPRQLPRPQRRDLVVHQGSLGPGERGRAAGLCVTSGPRTFVDLASMLDLPDLVAVGDSVLRAGHTIEELTAIIDRRVRFRGKRAARAALDWLDAGAESPQESRLRVALRRGGLPRPRVNAEIFDAAGRFLARGDLVFDLAMLVVEYDGAHHLSVEQQRRDAERRARLQAAGWMVLELNGQDLHDPRRAVARVRAALRARGIEC